MTEKEKIPEGANRPGPHQTGEEATTDVLSTAACDPILHAIDANEAHEHILKGTAEPGSDMAIGKFLLEQSNRIEPGHWLMWLRANLIFNNAKADEYMSAHLGCDYRIPPATIGPRVSLERNLDNPLQKSIEFSQEV